MPLCVKDITLGQGATKQPLSVFRELLNKLACSCADHPYSGRSPVSVLDCEKRTGWTCSVSPHGAAHRHPSPLESVGNRAFNALELLTPYQAELCHEYNQTHDQMVWDKIPVITKRCTV